MLQSAQYWGYMSSIRVAKCVNTQKRAADAADAWWGCSLHLSLILITQKKARQNQASLTDQITITEGKEEE